MADAAMMVVVFAWAVTSEVVMPVMLEAVIAVVVKTGVVIWLRQPLWGRLWLGQL